MQVWKGVFVIRCKELPTDLGVCETIKDIDGFNGLYAITSRGRVWGYPNDTRSKGHWLKPRIDNQGYAKVGLYLGNKKYKWIFIHRLVAIAYIPNPQNKPFINHKDFNRVNNNIENLEWCTHWENMNYSYERGRFNAEVRDKALKKAQQKAWEKKTYLIAHKAVQAKKTYLKMIQVAKEMRTWEKAHIAAWKVLKKKTKLFKDGIFIAEFDSIKEAAKYASDKGWCSFYALRAFKKSRGCTIESN